MILEECFSASRVNGQLFSLSAIAIAIDKGFSSSKPISLSLDCPTLKVYHFSTMSLGIVAKRIRVSSSVKIIRDVAPRVSNRNASAMAVPTWSAPEERGHDIYAGLRTGP